METKENLETIIVKIIDIEHIRRTSKSLSEYGGLFSSNDWYFECWLRFTAEPIKASEERKVIRSINLGYYQCRSEWKDEKYYDRFCFGVSKGDILKIKFKKFQEFKIVPAYHQIVSFLDQKLYSAGERYLSYPGGELYWDEVNFVKNLTTKKILSRKPQTF